MLVQCWSYEVESNYFYLINFVGIDGTMKKIQKIMCTTIASIYLFATSTSYAQNNIRIGITGGLNASQIKTSTNLTDFLWKYNAGIAFEKNVIGNLSLAAELGYSRQGSKLALNQSSTYVTHFDYIALPILARFRPGGKQLFIQIGGKFGYLINGREMYTNNNYPNDLNHLRKWDAGAVAGVGYWLGKHLALDARYYYGMAGLIKKHPIVDPGTGQTFYGADNWNSRVWSLNLTYIF
jgi:hypothetical protein